MSRGFLAMVLLMLGGGAMLLVAIGSRTHRVIITRRVEMIAAAHVDTLRAGPLPRITRFLRMADEFISAVFSFRKSHDWGTRSHSPILLAIGLLGGAGAWLVTRTMLGLPGWIAVPLTIMAFLTGPHLKLSMEQAKTEALFTDRFPNAIDSIIRMLRAGLPISAAIRAVATEPSPPVDAVFRVIADQMDIGVPLDVALAAAGQRIDLPDFRFFTVAVALQHATGGNLTTTLEILSDIIRKRRAMRLKAKAVTAEVRMTSYILASIPLVIVAGLLAINPNYLAPLISDPRGNVIVVIAVGSLATGFLTMRQMMRHATRI
ncbi:type II secretion system F family protein [Sphingobium nicotianae]|uniref:Type II secretion system F family protein n=1 Tax=Sphingobium nicotianae TaxID=2782607 RepID=A0A9X1DF45_9SPHN|nr:type II secretion system F family protein [Sphingobium nicotianae]MBT2189077.1 type II secretion system F family protein [Sphingobium nicotianae]